MGQYPLLHNDTEAGTVRVCQEGMYCKIVCTSNQECLLGCNVVVKSGKKSIDLGKCSKDPNGYVLRRFIPARVLGEGALVFSVSNAVERRDRMIVLDPCEAFDDIALLPRSKFVSGHAGRGIVIEDKD